ncbi:MAG: PilZ domain-containing protein [Hyphomonas sp.]|nr:PilZ domain-containing protein [Hyphomonas sp.]
MSAPQLSMTHASPLAKSERDRRQHERIDLEIGGCYLDEESQDHKLVTENLSCSGALMRAATIPSEGSNVICYFDDLGRVAATVVRTSEDGFAVQFNVVPHKREKLANRLSWLANKGEHELPEERTAPRYPTSGHAQVIRKNGQHLACNVIDISLTGASLETHGALPAIGEIVIAGNLQGRVVRVGEGNFAINFLRKDERED